MSITTIRFGIERSLNPFWKLQELGDHQIKSIRFSCDPQSPFTAFNVGRIENDHATLFSILLIWNLYVKKCAKKLGFTACRLRK